MTTTPEYKLKPGHWLPGIETKADLDAAIIKQGGSIISSDTLSMSDLVPIFLDYLDGFEGFTDLIVETEATFNHMIDLEQEKSYWKNEEWIKASDYLNYLVYERVFDALNNVSPQGFYFGASEGDGACFGFWKAEEEEF